MAIDFTDRLELIPKKVLSGGRKIAKGSGIFCLLPSPKVTKASYKGTEGTPNTPLENSKPTPNMPSVVPTEVVVNDKTNEPLHPAQ